MLQFEVLEADKVIITMAHYKFPHKQTNQLRDLCDLVSTLAEPSEPPQSQLY
jgi:hypothetical protein